MSFSAICPNLNEQIANLAGEHFKLGTKSELGLLKGLTDQLSTGQIKVVPIDLGTGQIRTAQVMYQKRTPEDQVTTTINDCITGPYQESDNFAFTVNITDQVNLEFQYDDTKIRELCESRESWVAKDMMGKMDALYRVINRRAATVATANFGNYSDGTNSGTSPISLGLIQPLAAGGMNGANYQGESIMLNALSDARIVGKPMAFGTGALREYSDMRAIGNNNALGMDLSTDQNFIFLSDPIVSDVIGNVDEFLVMEAGSMQFIPVPQFVGQYQKISEFRGNATITDPRFGVSFDLNYFQPEGCPNQWKMRLSLNYALPVMYNDAYAPTDYLFGVNGIFKFDAA
jgi:hypothetical protein